jgi:hypothetical protein
MTWEKSEIRNPKSTGKALKAANVKTLYINTEANKLSDSNKKPRKDNTDSILVIRNANLPPFFSVTHPKTG